MKKLALEIVILLILLISAHILSLVITGLAAGDVDVSIKEKLKGEITAFSYEPALTIGQNQTILVEFTNIGTTNYTVMIEKRIYIYDNGTLNLTKQFYDASVPLKPGMRRAFKTYYLPTMLGIYYIQVKVHYATRTIETWGAFSVSAATVIEPIIPEGTIPPSEIISPGISDISLEYPETVDLYQNQSQIINITVNNIGETTLYNLRLYVSTTEDIGIDISPKEVYSLSINSSTTFLVLVIIPADLPTGQYLLDFEVVSDKQKKAGEIILDVSATIEIEDIYNKILNYEYLILKIESDIISASLKGFDVSLAEKDLNDAKGNLQSAREYYYLEKYEDALKKLGETERDLMDAVFQLHHAIFIYAVPVPLFIFILLIILIIIIIILLLLYTRRKKEKRPKLLRAVSET